MLTGASKYNGCEKVAQLLEALKGRWDAMVRVSSSNRVSVVIEIFDPVLQLIVLV